MKKLDFSIAKFTILESVALNAAYSGAKGDAAAFDRIATVAADEELLTGFWTEMCGVLSEKFRDFLISYTLTPEGLNVTMEVSGAYDDSLSASVVNDLKAAVTAGVTAKWFQFTDSSKVGEWKDESERMFTSALSKLCHRRRPRRQQH